MAKKPMQTDGHFAAAADRQSVSNRTGAVFCTNCGSRLAIAANYCTLCGERKLERRPEPYGFAGWLLLLIVFLTLGTLATAFSVFVSVTSYANATPGNKILHGFHAISYSAWVVAAGVCLRLANLQSKHFPKAVVLLLTSSLVISAASLALSQLLGSDTFAIVPGLVTLLQGFVPLVVWGAYVRVSRRVSNTFRGAPPRTRSQTQ